MDYVQVISNIIRKIYDTNMEILENQSEKNIHSSPEFLSLYNYYWLSMIALKSVFNLLDVCKLTAQNEKENVDINNQMINFIDSVIDMAKNSNERISNLNISFGDLGETGNYKVFEINSNFKLVSETFKSIINILETAKNSIYDNE